MIVLRPCSLVFEYLPVTGYSTYEALVTLKKLYILNPVFT